MIKRCDCSHKAQDKLHGKQMRVFNQTRKQDGKIYRCTVCNKEKM